MTPAVQSIIMKGLTCGTTRACEHGTMITAGPFSLYCGDPPVKKVQPVGGGMAVNAGPINFNSTPTLSHQNRGETPVLVPFNPDQPFVKRAPVTITFKWNDVKVEKVYMVRMNKISLIIKVSNLINSTKHNITINFRRIKKVNHNITVKLKSSRYFKGWRTPKGD